MNCCIVSNSRNTVLNVPDNNIIINSPTFVYNEYDINSNECLENMPDINCNYIDINKTNIISNNGLSIIHINARSIVNCFDDVIYFLDSIHNKFCLIVITETWLHEFNTKLYSIFIIQPTI